MDYFANCYYESDFHNMTHTTNLVSPVAQFVKIKEMLEEEYTPIKLGSYPSVLNSTRDNLRPYQFGATGSHSIMNSELSKINKVTNSDYFNESCFKHRWGYAVS